MHMTFFFAGETLIKLKGDVLNQFHQDVTMLTQESSTMVAVTIPLTMLKFSHLELFPPGKRNLVVAIFEASP